MASGLTKRFGATRAVDNLSFEVAPGAVTGLLGPNGAGKTTALRMLLGLVRPDAGSATFGGRRYCDLDTPTSIVGALLEPSGFHPRRSGLDHLRVYCAVNGYPPDRAREGLDQVGLGGAAGRAVAAYSLGMRQRLAVATALLGRPSVLIADEPFNGLDPAGIAWLRELLSHLARDGATVLVSSHVLSELSQSVERVIIVDRGRLVAEGGLAELAGRHDPVVSVRTPQAEQLAAALAQARAAGARVERVGPDRLRVLGMSADDIGRLAHRDGIEIAELAPDRGGGLEALFFSLTGASGDSGAGGRGHG